MASLTPSTCNATTTANSSSNLTNALSSCPFFTKTSQVSLVRKQSHGFKVSCKATDGDQNPTASSKNGEPSLAKSDRRNVLIGLGGLYGAASLGVDSLAFAAPIQAPDLTKCVPAAEGFTGAPVQCCPPNSGTIIDYKLPAPPKKPRVRPAAHSASKEYIEKYNRAIKLMKELPEDDPRSFMQQADVHCAYCNGAYEQVGFPDLDFQVHNSWLFFPFHRWYLYFYERILADLINDPTFALPFWNWDGAPAGMQLPPIFADTTAAIYDPLRNAAHQPPKVMDLNYGLSDDTSTDTTTDDEQLATNLKIMYRQMVSNAKNPSKFFGSAYRAGDAAEPGAGSIEHIPHTPVHIWTGDPDQTNNEDMGNFYSAGRDPVFYSHHSNVDRMWTVWKTLGKKNQDLTDPDWLDSSFLFYDEKKQLVRVKVRDCLDNKKMGYVYQDVPIPWLKSRPTPRVSKEQKKLSKAGVAQAAEAPANAVFPITLDKVVKVTVPRPKKKRSQKEKEDEDETLIIEGIELDKSQFAKFDVYINDERDKPTGPGNSEFAGSFTNLAHKHKMDGMSLKTSLRLGITDLLEDLGAEDDDSVLAMASLTTPSTCNATTTTLYSSSNLTSVLSSCPFFNKSSQLSTVGKQSQKFKVSCKTIDGDQNPPGSSKNGEPSVAKPDRRNVLIGLGGLYGAAHLSIDHPLAFGKPIQEPDIKTCVPANEGFEGGPVQCCPPKSRTIIDYQIPPKKIRVRRSAHLVIDDKEYIEKYNRAIHLMKNLHPDDPRNFMQQANVHCAYCNGAYQQVGYPNLDLQVHNSWLFFPFHRWYLYFYERILGDLICDPAFALPFWNWDTLDGMHLPHIFADPSSQLYDINRNPKHQPPTIIDLNYGLSSDTSTDTTPDDVQVDTNLKIMYRQMVCNCRTPDKFFGCAYRAGQKSNPGAGNIEHIPHIPVHLWTGDPCQTNNEDMGNFYSAARDPVFFSLHSNIDRMWTIWKTLREKNQDLTDPDWLDSAFLFYDEKKQLVRVKIRDCLDHTKLGYVYEDVPIPWLNTPPTPLVSKEERKLKKADRVEVASPSVVFPIILDKIVQVTITRPEKLRSRKDKEERDETLVIQDIVLDDSMFVKFDVLINNTCDKPVGPGYSEFAGRFTNLPHKHKNHGMTTTSLRLGLTCLLEDLGAEDDDSLLVTLVPKSKSFVTIGDIKIDFNSCQD
ncbi:hypothetical protein F0562_024591 [Nyssa sinensis]|uniref:Tyrosinase copper-binding domain-containing protein n=1 Tax=Nyssa sinensis TaxID=561372 RepID=A0A5J5BDS4_9ASTE|nr:hypothetical protein F0562_024591 [Nyssa sinensis]